MTPTLKASDGTMFTQKTLEVWDGLAYVVKPLKVWNGSEWVLVGGVPPVVGTEHSINLNGATLGVYTDGNPRIRLGSWFYSTGSIEMSCVGGRVYVPAGSPAIGGKVRFYAYLRTIGIPASGGDLGFNDYIRTKDADISATGWVDVRWDEPFSFFNGASGDFIFIAYEFLTAGNGYTGIYHAGNPGENNAIESTTLAKLFLAENSIRSGFAQGLDDNMSGASSGLWFGTDIIVNDNTALTGDAVRLFEDLTASNFSDVRENDITYNLGTEFYVLKQAWVTEIHIMMPIPGNGTLNDRRISIWRVDSVSAGTQVVPQIVVTPYAYGVWNTFALPTPFELVPNQHYRAVVRLDAVDGYVAIASFFGTGIDHVNEYLVAPAATNSFGNDQGSYTLEGDIFPDQSFNYSFYGIDVTVVDTLG